jgi:hypothetical protein
MPERGDPQSMTTFDPRQPVSVIWVRAKIPLPANDRST